MSIPAPLNTPVSELIERHRSMVAAHPAPVDWRALGDAMFGSHRGRARRARARYDAIDFDDDLSVDSMVEQMRVENARAARRAAARARKGC